MHTDQCAVLADKGAATVPFSMGEIAANEYRSSMGFSNGCNLSCKAYSPEQTPIRPLRRKLCNLVTSDRDSRITSVEFIRIRQSENIAQLRIHMDDGDVEVLRGIPNLGDNPRNRDSG